ncbi:MAG TPA: DUF58 domain-containing protein [Longimicrobiales bacterium]|nr:DUF58 domain-containing protein [Longimicrobiales bacterium]
MTGWAARLGGLLDRTRAAFARPGPPTAPTAATQAAGDAGAGGVPREILRQVRLIELRTRGLVDTVFGGEYNSVFRGQGMEFSEVREYAAGDDVRHIDWNVTARMAHPFVKKHKEERELTVLLVIDVSGSGQFGTRGRFKAELAAELAAVLALSAVRNNDRVGLLVFTDRVEHFVPPRKGRRHVLRLIRDVLVYQPKHTGTDIDAALAYAARLLRHRAIVFLLSDFIHVESPVALRATAGARNGGSARPALDPQSDPQHPWERALRLMAGRHDLVAVRTADPLELRLPTAGLIVVADPETGELVPVDTGDAALHERYHAEVAQEDEVLRRLFRRLAIDEIAVRTHESYIRPLLAFFEQRDRKRRR